jgi:competence protein ComGC
MEKAKRASGGQCQKGVMTSPISRNRKSGLTLVEVLVVIGVLALLVFLLVPYRQMARHERKHVSCLSNLNEIWKSISAWSLDPDYSDRPNFPTNHIVGWDGALTAGGGLFPDMFICPTAREDYRTRPSSSLFYISEFNSSYCYFAGRTDAEGEKVILCDQDGPRTVATTNNWGHNHRDARKRPLGGNIVKVAGAGMWVSTTNDPELYKVCITNPDIASAFATGTNITVYLY